MSTKFKSIDYKIKCPYYEKNLESCPSSKIRLTDEELHTIINKCVKDEYKNCTIYQKLAKEKAA